MEGERENMAYSLSPALTLLTLADGYRSPAWGLILGSSLVRHYR